MSRIRRRTFIRTGLLAGGAMLLSKQLAASDLFLPRLFGMKAPGPGEEPDIVTITAKNLKEDINNLLEPLGGISQFVKPGQVVGILANSPWKNPGYYTNPDVVLALADLCSKAGAGKLICFKPVNSGYWDKGKLKGDYASLISAIEFGTDRVEISIQNGISLKNAEVYKEVNDVDVFISVPVAKHHAGTIFSGNLKGMMGFSSPDTNRHMHSPDGEYTYEETEFLAQCIADLCLIRKPDLCVIDAMECATSNGPAGPGNTVKPGKLVAGKDPLATDVFAARLIGFDPDEILTFSRAYEHKLGETDLSKLTLLEL